MFNSYVYLTGVASRMTIPLKTPTIADQFVEAQPVLPPIPLLQIWRMHSPPIIKNQHLCRPLWWVHYVTDEVVDSFSNACLYSTRKLMPPER